jgi:hypothetical protein
MSPCLLSDSAVSISSGVILELPNQLHQAWGLQTCSKYAGGAIISQYIHSSWFLGVGFGGFFFFIFFYF